MLVAERRRDLAIRAALGASRQRLLWSVGREGAILAGFGVIGGLGSAALVARSLTTLLYGVRPYDPVAFGGAALLVLATSLLMTAAAAIRTATIVPAAVLRQE
jgi:ABC-type antimicrobial peptide transport system permease subunit